MRKQVLGPILNQNGASQVQGNTATHFIVAQGYKLTDEERYKQLEGCAFVTPMWVTAAIKNGFAHEPVYYSPDPEMIFSGMVVTSYDLSEYDEHHISGLVKDFGGMYIATLSNDVTHLVTMSAESGKFFANVNEGTMTIVARQFVEQSTKLARHLHEKWYAWPKPLLLTSKTTELISSENIQHTTYVPFGEPSIHPPSHPSDFYLKVHHSNKFNLDPKPYLAHECIYIEPALKRKLPDSMNWKKHLMAAGAQTAETYDSTKVTIAIVENRSSVTYLQASKDAKFVASCWWLTNTMWRQEFIPPFRSLLDYPSPKGMITEKSSSIIVTISGYRDITTNYYLQYLAAYCGFVYSAVLTKETNYAICASKHSKLYQPAKEMNVAVVNHIWLEECFRDWKIYPPDKDRYIYFFESKNITMEDLVGLTQIDTEQSRYWWSDQIIRPKEAKLVYKDWKEFTSKSIVDEFKKKHRSLPQQALPAEVSSNSSLVTEESRPGSSKEKRLRSVTPASTPQVNYTKRLRSSEASSEP
ncbi:hypothetical protein BJV82DRAFT_664374 [Fennellomyces sp. T-0311]|nr:hypothetical protein BJV82DRAFT_664374 [Fennellomyces sp. T-0311]